MTNAYDRERAHKLVPLLTSITHEMRERQLRILALAGEAKGLPATAKSRALDIRAEIATQRGALRLAKEELHALGCYVDDENPYAVYIPGSDESYAFRWESGEQVKRVLRQTDTPVS